MSPSWDRYSLNQWSFLPFWVWLSGFFLQVAKHYDFDNRRRRLQLKILFCHNYYQQPGGEDQSFAAEASLLESHGHQVLRFTRHNDAIARMVGAEIVKQSTIGRRNRAFEAPELIRAFTDLERQLASPAGDTRSSPPARRVPRRSPRDDG